MVKAFGFLQSRLSDFSPGSDLESIIQTPRL